MENVVNMRQRIGPMPQKIILTILIPPLLPSISLLLLNKHFHPLLLPDLPNSSHKQLPDHIPLILLIQGIELLIDEPTAEHERDYCVGVEGVADEVGYCVLEEAVVGERGWAGRGGGWGLGQGKGQGQELEDVGVGSG